MDILEIILGQIPEAIYFALFMILTKGLKEKRLLFTCLMILEYILVMNVEIFSTWAHVIYIGLTFVALKVLYKEKAQITDVFTFGIASLVLMGVSLLSTLVLLLNFNLGIIVSRILPFVLLFIFKHKLHNIQKLYKKLWNRNDKVKTIMKSATFRCLNVIIFNLMFYTINAGMIYAVLIRK